MSFTGTQPNDAAAVPISSVYDKVNNAFPALQGADGGYVDAFGNTSNAPVMSFIQPRIVQKAPAQTGSGAKTLSCSFANPNTGGNSIVVCLGVGDVEDAVTGFQVTDSKGNTYTKVASSSQGGTLESVVYFATGIASGANIITVNITGPTAVATAIALEIYEVFGLIASSGALDQVAIGSSASSTSAATGALQPLVPNELAFSSLAVGKTVTITPGVGWSPDSGTLFPWGGNLNAFSAQSMPLSTIAALSPTITLSLQGPWTMACATFKSITLPVQGTFNFAPANNAPMTSVAPSLSPVQFLAANGARKGVSVFNASNPLSSSAATIFLAYGAVTSKNAYVTQIPPGALWEMPMPIVPLPLYGWWNVVNGSANITEIS